MKFRKKPIVIEANKYTKQNADVILNWAASHGVQVRYKLDMLVIPTLEGDHFASDGDWIIKGIKGEFYPCKPDIFEATYELVEPQRETDKERE